MEGPVRADAGATAAGGQSEPDIKRQSSAIARQNNSFVHKYEQIALHWLVHRLPGWVTSDMLTLFGVLGAVMTGLAWYLAMEERLWLIMGNVGIVIHWYGDSLDGLAARTRDLSRPKYGFFIDILADIVSTAIWLAGLAAGDMCGQWFWLPVGLILPLFMLIIMLDLFNVALAPKREHNIDAAGVSGTEARMVFIAANFAFMALDDDAVQIVAPAVLAAFGAFGAIFCTVRSYQLASVLRAVDDAALAARHAAKKAAAAESASAGAAAPLPADAAAVSVKDVPGKLSPTSEGPVDSSESEGSNATPKATEAKLESSETRAADAPEAAPAAATDAEAAEV